MKQGDGSKICPDFVLIIIRINLNSFKSLSDLAALGRGERKIKQ